MNAMYWPTRRLTLIYTLCTLTFGDLSCQDCLILCNIVWLSSLTKNKLKNYLNSLTRSLSQLTKKLKLTFLIKLHQQSKV